MIKVLVTGSNGQLGSELKEFKNSVDSVDFVFTDFEELDITDYDKVKSFFEENSNIGLIINCAAYTAVDNAEKEYQKARLINVYGVSNLAEMSELYHIPIIHLSTDYVYGGTANKPISEDFPENPQSVYGKTKFDGEEILMATTNNHLIIRTSWLYSSYGINFVKTILRVAKEKDKINVIYDQVGTPTYAADLAKVIVHIINEYIKTKKIPTGIFHFSNEGVCSWYDFAIEIIKMSKLNCEVLPILTSEYNSAAERPSFSVLNKSKIKETLKITIPYWKNSLERCINKILGN